MIVRALILAAVSFAVVTPCVSADGEWPHEYMRGPVVIPCIDNDQENCVWHRLLIDNQTADTLECTGQIVYDAANREGNLTAERKMVVVPKARKAVVADLTSPDINAKSHSVRCNARKPPDDSKLTPKCKATKLNAPSELEYPPESRRAGEEGPVLVEFSLTDKDAHPTDITVAGSSLWPRLDAAGIKYVSQFMGAADCVHGRFRITVTFQLK